MDFYDVVKSRKTIRDFSDKIDKFFGVAESTKK